MPPPSAAALTGQLSRSRAYLHSARTPSPRQQQQQQSAPTQLHTLLHCFRSARAHIDIMSYEADQYEQRDRSPRRRSRSPRRSRRSYSPRSRSRSRDRDEYRRSDRRSRSPTGGAQGAGNYQSYGGAGRGAPARSVEGKDNMMQSIRDSSQQDRRVYVGNLSYDVKWHHLKDFMRQGTRFGEMGRSKS
jgi:hypothetical protein